MHWVLSGKLFLWLDAEGAQTTGSAPEVSIAEFNYTAETALVGDAVLIQQAVRRSIQVTALINTQSGSMTRACSHDFSMDSKSSLSDKGDTQHVEGLYEHADSSSVDEGISFFSNGSYPINSDSQYRAPDGDYDFTIKAALLSVLNLNLGGRHVFPTGLEPFVHEAEESWNESAVHTWRRSSAFFHASNGGNSSGGSGETEQSYELTGAVPLYMRFVSVANETTVRDDEFGLGRRQSHMTGSGITDPEPTRQSKLDSLPHWPSLGQHMLRAWPEQWNRERQHNLRQVL
jgi:hypothetical protein